jgi:predicted pyridoxine 5'-phosphate oxidase superfamily flavin-nucleotide-binding protein
VHLLTKIDTKEHNNRKNVNTCIRNLDTNRDRKQLIIFERKMYRRIPGPVYDSEKENWRILTNKEIYAIVKNPL